jgi:hypothetical protein
MDTHRTQYKCWKNGKHNLITSFNLFEKHGIKNCEIILLESVNANSKDELLAREAYWIKQVDCVNKVIPNRTDKQYREDHKEEIAERHKQYYNDNKEKAKQYYNDNKQDILEQHKEYYEDNKEKIVEYHKKYYEKNKKELSEQRKQTYICIVCNTTITLNYKSKHENTKKHLNNVDFSNK